MTELVIAGFGEKHRGVEVLAQIQRLRFSWTPDLDNSVVVEVEANGGLRMLYSQLLDPAAVNEASQWRALLSALVPSPHLPPSSSESLTQEILEANERGDVWLKSLSSDSEFSRNVTALLQPGNSVIFTTIDDWQAAVDLLSGYTRFLLHTPIEWSRVERRRPYSS